LFNFGGDRLLDFFCFEPGLCHVYYWLLLLFNSTLVALLKRFSGFMFRFNLLVGQFDFFLHL